MTNSKTADEMANAIRSLAMDAVEKANSGHPGLPMGCADIATVLFTKVMKFDPAHPEWPDRDRFVLSAGHGSMLLYSVLYLLGYEDATLDQLKNFRQLGSKTAGHPEHGYLKGIETTTGPLGQGVGNAVGMAIAEAKLAAEFGKEGAGIGFDAGMGAHAAIEAAHAGLEPLQGAVQPFAGDFVSHFVFGHRPSLSHATPQPTV